MKHTLFHGLSEELHRSFLAFVVGAVLGAALMAVLKTGPVVSENPPMGGGMSSYSYSSMTPPNEYHCGDDVDNDNDSLVDCEDTADCTFSSYCMENCTNGIDDDGDLDVDCDDAFCTNHPNCR
jgi:hypothetical protein